uniref:Uncharacterized protein n=1 Tax=Amphimedon queenslandica TaxID=400682 RepID=A0A1X7UB67_AMPQE
MSWLLREEREFFFYLGPQVFIIFGQQSSAASTWRCLGSLVATTASDAKSTTYKKNMHILLHFNGPKHSLKVGSSIVLPPRGAAWDH